MRRLTVLAVLASALLASACNTISGMGRDVSSAGRAVAGAAEDARR